MQKFELRVQNNRKKKLKSDLFVGKQQTIDLNSISSMHSLYARCSFTEFCLQFPENSLFYRIARNFSFSPFQIIDLLLHQEKLITKPFFHN